MAANQNEIDRARKLARAIALKVERQTKALNESQEQLQAYEAYIRGLEKTSPTK